MSKDRVPGISPFNRLSLNETERFTYIGSGSLGGKAQGLRFIKDILAGKFAASDFPRIEVSIPDLTVLRTDLFDAFLQRNCLFDIANSDAPDDRIAHAFQQGDLPAEIVGDLRDLISKIQNPLAIRSSSLLEDAMFEPFAGIYATKMIPNNQHDIDTRFRKLMEAIKFVYATTYFKAARDYRKATGHDSDVEKMAVIIQEVVGNRHNDRFYPEVSGVARSYNFYSTGHARPDDGVVNLALGLGKTIVDGGTSWTYSPAHPKVSPPFGSISQWLKQTQTEFWAVNMAAPPAYDPIKETEYLSRSHLADAETDDTLRLIVSTYDSRSDRISMGVGAQGSRILTFAPLLQLGDIPLNELIKSLLHICEGALDAPVEIEFAMTFKPVRFGFLQVRPMVVSDEKVDLSEDEFMSKDVLLASEKVMGNGIIETIADVVYVKPENFDAASTLQIAQELEQVNRMLTAKKTSYLLIGFGRWGSSDPWLGIPARWGQISGARVIVEATLPTMDKELSQGSHFFHNIMSFRVNYFSVSHSGQYQIDWQWLAQQKKITETRFVCHARLTSPLRVKVDGRSGRGVIQKTKH